tara:strand:- start:203 stop:397 length:195 start_codon:yes stop_codon:yes gene_type:complete
MPLWTSLPSQHCDHRPTGTTAIEGSHWSARPFVDLGIRLIPDRNQKRSASLPMELTAEEELRAL